MIIIKCMQAIDDTELLLEKTITDHVQTMRALTQSQLMYLKYFVGNLSTFDCFDDDPKYTPDYWLSKFTPEERHKWNQPIQGVWRSQFNVTYPCDKSAWVQGNWQAVPMWSHCCNKGFGIARCPDRVIEAPTHCVSKMQALSGECADDTTLICPSFVPIASGTNNNGRSSPYLVYTFGIANLWEFEDWAGELGCEVHAFDPTIKYLEKHQAHSSKNVFFHYEGLKGPSSKSTASKLVSTSYGELGGEFFTLSDLWVKYGHRAANRSIDLIKIDCEGCEWESLVSTAKHSPEVLRRVCTIVMEVHVVNSLQMKNLKQLMLMSDFWRLFIEEIGFRLWYVHKNPGGVQDREVNRILLHLGLEENICCYEIAIHRPGCSY